LRGPLHRRDLTSCTPPMRAWFEGSFPQYDNHRLARIGKVHSAADMGNPGQSSASKV
jgi:hypothetical protein